MRRKLFFYVFLLVIITAFTTNYYIFFEKSNTEYEMNPSTHTGKIISIENDESGRTRLTVDLDSSDKVLLNYYGKIDISQKYYGSKISFYSTLELPKQSRNPKCFDYRLYLKSKGIKYISATEKIEIKKEKSKIYDEYCRFLLVKKEGFLNSIKDETSRSFIDGILFGNSDNLEQELYEEFKVNGTAHILAVSGLHINIVYNVIQKILGKRQNIINFIFTVIILWSLGILAGWTPSVTRAVGMIFLKMYGLYNDLRYDSLSALSLLTLLMIADNPYVIFDVSFQMSFLAVLAIIFVIPHIPSKIPEFVAVTLTVNVVLTLYQIFQFNSMSVTSLLANIPVVFLATTLLPMFFMQFAIFIICGISMNIFLQPTTELIVSINRVCTLGMDNINITSPPFWTVVFIYLTVGFLISESFYILWSRKNMKAIIIAILSIFILSCVLFICTVDEFEKSELIFVDVGQGDCIHLKAGNVNVLIDGGGSTNYEVGKKTVMPYLLKNGVSKVDLALATHRHVDHYKGLEELKEEGIINSIEVGLTAGKSYKISKDIFIETLWPIEKPENDINQDENKNCSVFMIYYGKTKIMITGDLDEEGERKLMDYYKDNSIIKADILKIGHHGSQYSTSLDFLEAVEPDYCVIQVGDNNYGHPHTKTIEKCEEKCIILLRNDIHGAIGFSLDEETINHCTMF